MSATSSGSRGLLPGIGGGARPDMGSPILPLHHAPNAHSIHSPLSPLQSYPPLEHTWTRLRNWLSQEYTELGDTLNYGISPQVITSVQMELGLPLPSAVRDSYLICDGQEVESSAGCSDGLFFGLSLLPLEDVLEEWRFWREVDEDPATGANDRLRSVMRSIPDGYVRKEYSCRGWLPLVTDRAGNYLGVDLHPDAGGTYGQVIVFGRDFDTKVVLWRGEGEGGWGRWLAGFVDELENGEGYEMNNGGGDSSGSEDEIGYEGYFYTPDSVGRADGEKVGGLRLTGDYKGWNVLEAWADKSVKRWIQAGLYKEEPMGAPPGTKPEIEITDAVAIAVTSDGPATEVAIPVVGEVPGIAVKTDDLPPLPSSDITEGSSSISPATPKALISPTSPASVTPIPKPAPKPAPMPTASDLLGDNSPTSTNPNSPRLSEDDPQHQRLNSAPSRQLTGSKMRYASEASDLSASSDVALVDSSFEASHATESSMTEATLLPPAVVEDDAATARATPSPRREDLELKTPTALHFPASTFADLQKKSPTPNGTPNSTSDSPGVIPPPPSASRPARDTPEVEAGATTVVTEGDSRPATPSSVKSTSSGRLQKGAHKKSTKSISKLFESGSVKGSDDDSEKKEKRSSLFGSPLKSKMVLNKEKKNPAETVV